MVGRDIRCVDVRDVFVCWWGGGALVCMRLPPTLRERAGTGLGGPRARPQTRARLALGLTAGAATPN